MDSLRCIAEEIERAENNQEDRPYMLNLWARRRALVGVALKDERRPADIARALKISPNRIQQIIKGEQ